MAAAAPADERARLRVLLVGNDAVFRRGLRDLLRDEIEVTGEVWSGEVAAVRAADERPDVVLLAAEADGLDGIGTLRRIHERSPDTPVVLLAASREAAHPLYGVVAETSGLILKDAGIEEIVLGLRAAAAGEAYLSPAVTQGLLARMRALTRHLPDVSAAEALSPRENEVLRHLARGMGNAEIAAELGITVRTVKAHVSSILQKLGVENRVQAAVAALTQDDGVETGAPVSSLAA